MVTIAQAEIHDGALSFYPAMYLRDGKINEQPQALIVCMADVCFAPRGKDIRVNIDLLNPVASQRGLLETFLESIKPLIIGGR